MKEVTLEAITDTQSWYKIWLLDGFNLIRAKRKLLREEECTKISRTVGKNDSHLYSEFLGIWQIL